MSEPCEPWSLLERMFFFRRGKVTVAAIAARYVDTCRIAMLCIDIPTSARPPSASHLFLDPTL